MKMTPNSTLARFFDHKHKLVIAGPCSFGSGTDVETSVEICQFTDLFRTSMWKPRTLPGGFEGVGASGIDELEDVILPPVTEVFDKASVNACVGKIENVWIGSRTACDPFAMRELAEAISEHADAFTSIGIKNPPCKDVALWVGAIKRINMVAPSKVYAIFRGVKTLDSTYRNYPDFSFLVEVVTTLKSEGYDIPVVLDSSHICGEASMIEDFTKQAFTIYPFDGVMIECSTNPEQVKSDSKQHIHPYVLERISDWIHYSAPVVKQNISGTNPKIDEARRSIKMLDIQMFQMLSCYLEERNLLVDTIAKEKANENSCIFVPERYDELKRFYQVRFAGIIPAEMLNTVFDTVHNLSILKQAKIIHNIDAK